MRVQVQVGLQGMDWWRTEIQSLMGEQRNDLMPEYYTVMSWGPEDVRLVEEDRTRMMGGGRGEG